MKLVIRTALSWGLMATVATLPAVAEELEGPFLERYDLRQTLVPVAPELGEFKSCLEYCLEMEVELVRYECSPIFAPPTSGCSLPFIDPSSPSPLPLGNRMEDCIPEEAEQIGYELREHRSLVQRIVRHEGCRSTSEDTVLAVLPDQGPPARECPDARGPWVDEQSTIHWVRFNSCE